MGVLAEVLHLFNIAAAPLSQVIAWSAGAMALTDRIVLFHDRSPQGPGHPEVYGSGLSLLRDVVLLPHARARLLLDDAPRMAVFARRFAPARCMPLEAGTRLDVGRDGGWPPGTRVLAEDGHVTTLEARPDAPAGPLPRSERPSGQARPSTGSGTAGRWTAAAVDRFLARQQVPIIEGARCTFLYRGEADEVFLVHRIFGLPDHLPLRRLHGTDLWYLVLELPEGSRVEYQLELVRGGQRERINDPLNPYAGAQPDGQLLGLLRARAPDPRLDHARPGRTARIAGGHGGAEPRAAPGQPRSRCTCRPGSAVPPATRC